MAGPQLMASNAQRVGDPTTVPVNAPNAVQSRSIPPQVQAIINQRIAQAGGVTPVGTQPLTQGSSAISPQQAIGNYQSSNAQANANQSPMGETLAINPPMMDTNPQNPFADQGQSIAALGPGRGAGPSMATEPTQQPAIHPLSNPGQSTSPMAARPMPQMTPQPPKGAQPINDSYLQKISRISPNWAHRIRGLMMNQN